MQNIQFIQTEPDELIAQIVQDLKNSLLPELKKEFQPKTPTEFLTRHEVAELLKIDLSSVHNWSKKGILTSYGIGGRVYFKRTEVENAIQKL